MRAPESMFRPGPRLEALRDIVRSDFASADKAHDIDHLERVERLADRLARAENGRTAVARAAALVHDYHRLDGDHGLGTTGAGGAAVIERVLHRAEFGSDLVEAIIDCVAFTDRYAMAGDDLRSPSVEASIVRDADNLDAMGAIGIARAFAFGATLSEPMWQPDTPIRDAYDRGHAPSVIHHFYEKLLRLHDELITPPAQALGRTRHAELERFVRQFRREWLAEG